MSNMRRECAVFICTFIVLFMNAPTVNCWSKPGGRPLELISRSDEAGRLRRGFHTSSLATARGFGKRSSNLGAIPFVSSKPEEGIVQAIKFGRKLDYDGSPLDQLKDGRLPVSTFVQLLQMDQDLATNFVSRFIDTDEDGFITASELERQLQN